MKNSIDKQYAYQNEYNKNHYDRFQITSPKGTKDAAKKQAAKKGISVSAYITGLIAADVASA